MGCDGWRGINGMKIELRGVSKFYGRARALDRASLEIEPGQIVALLGANGSGKTTLLRCLYGLTMPDKGAIYYDDEEFSRDNMAMRKRMFFMPDFPFVFAEMTVLQHVGMCLKLYEAQRPGVEELTVALLKEFDLLPLAERPMASMSRGQFYKAALCALFAVDPDVWMFDEPLASGMDPNGITAFKNRARDAAKRGKTVLYSTQILDVAERFSDRVCILDGGEVKAFGRLAELETLTTSKGLEDVFRALKETP